MRNVYIMWEEDVVFLLAAAPLFKVSLMNCKPYISRH